MVLFHRFYAKHSFTEHDRFEAAAAALLLAAKTEESPKKLTHVIQECHRLKNRGLQKQKEVMAGAAATAAAAAGRNSPVPIGYLDTKGEEFAKLKDRILLLERVILHTIGFELSIDHPYKFLVEQVKKMLVARQVEYITPPPPPSTSTAAGPSSSPPSNMAKMTNELVQYAMNFANDSMHTSLCLQFNAKTIALACVYMSVKFTKVRPTEGKMWSDILGIEMEALACKFHNAIFWSSSSFEWAFEKIGRLFKILGGIFCYFLSVCLLCIFVVGCLVFLLTTKFGYCFWCYWLVNCKYYYKDDPLAVKYFSIQHLFLPNYCFVSTGRCDLLCIVLLVVLF